MATAMTLPVAPQAFAPYAPAVLPQASWAGQVNAAPAWRPATLASPPAITIPQVSHPVFATLPQVPAPTPVSVPVAAAPLPQQYQVTPAPVAAPAVPTAAPAPAVPAKRRSKAKTSQASLFAETKAKMLYMKAGTTGSGSSLKITGAATHLAKKPLCIYHGLGRLFGTVEEIVKVMGTPEYQEAMQAAGADLSQINNADYFVNLDTFHRLRADPHSWLSREFDAIKQQQAKPEVSLTSLTEEVDNLANLLRQGRSKISGQERPAEAFRQKMIDVKAQGKVIDVSAFNPMTCTGYKVIARPRPDGRSTRAVLPHEHFAVCSTNAAALKGFLSVLGYDEENIKHLMAMWEPPVVKAPKEAKA